MKGFTLIELLIVIAIIGILAVALLPTVLSAPAKGRDAARQANLAAITTAIEAFNIDKGGYPGAVICFNGGTSLNVARFGSTTADTEIATYFQGKQIPKDPSGTSAKVLVSCPAGSYAYCPIAGTPGQNYYLVSFAEVAANANQTGANAAISSACAATPPAVVTSTSCPTTGCAMFQVK